MTWPAVLWLATTVPIVPLIALCELRGWFPAPRYYRNRDDRREALRGKGDA